MPAWGYVLDASRAHRLPDYQVFSHTTERVRWTGMEFPSYGSKDIQRQTGHAHGRVGERALCNSAAAKDDGAGS